MMDRHSTPHWGHGYVPLRFRGGGGCRYENGNTTTTAETMGRFVNGQDA